MLSPYRVLDLTNERGLLCGKLLGDLGANIVKIEPPEGSSARHIGPFVKSPSQSRQSLTWMAFTQNHKSITLSLQTETSRELFRKLISTSDFLIESFAPGYMNSLGLGYDDLRQLNPKLIMVSITPFGQTGPWRNYQATDLTGVALGGSMYLTGDPDRPPVRISHSPQFWLVGAASGAAGGMIAHHYRMLTGVGQHVDVSCQQAITRTLSHAPQMWDLNGKILKRNGAYRQVGSATTRISFPCKDGYISFFYPGGAVGARSMAGLAHWMEEQGIGDPFLRETRWENFEFGTLNQDTLDRILDPILRFFSTRTKKELSEGAMLHRVILFPVSDAKDLLENDQLEARGFYNDVTYEELGQTVRQVGSFIKTPLINRADGRKAPNIGEHNPEILCQELGLTKEKLRTLQDIDQI